MTDFYFNGAKMVSGTGMRINGVSDPAYINGVPVPTPISLPVITTTSPQTVTIQEWNAIATTNIDWGDGSTTVHPANTGTTINHSYAVAGSYTIKLWVAPINVRRIDLRHVALRPNTTYLKPCTGVSYFYLTGGIAIINSADMAAWRPITWACYGLPAGSTVTINSADMAAWRPTNWQCSTLPAGSTVNINSADMAAWRPTVWYCFTLPAGSTVNINSADMAAWRPTSWFCFTLPAGSTVTINSADMAAWRPTSWQCYTLPAGSTVTINSADMAAWRPTVWYCYSLPAGSTVTINSADMAAWRPTVWHCYSLPAGSTVTVAAIDFAGWTSPTNFRIDGNALTQAKVDAVLEGFYGAFASRTVSNGTINVGGTNAAPSGTYQAMCPPTSGKERAYELVNDSCGINPTKKWLTVTITL